MERRIAVGKNSRITRRRVIIALLAAGLVLALCAACDEGPHSLRKAKESVLRENLFVLRELMRQYRIDKARPPEVLDDLVNAGYLKQLPIDPFTNSRTTWIAVYGKVSSKAGQELSGIVDIHSGSNLTGLNGIPYSNW